MRRSLLVTLLAASALVPTTAMAQDEGRQGRGQRQMSDGTPRGDGGQGGGGQDGGAQDGGAQDRAAFREQRQAQRGPDASMIQQQRFERRQERQAQAQAPVQAQVQVQPQAPRQPRQMFSIPATEASIAQQQQRRDGRQDRGDARQDFRQDRRDARQDFRQDRGVDRQDFRQDRREDRRDLQNGVVTPPQARIERRDDRQDFRRERRDDRQDFQQDRRDDRHDFQHDRRFDQNGKRGFNNDNRFNDNRFNNNRGFNNNQGFNNGYGNRGQNFGNRNRANDFRSREFNNFGNWNRGWRQNQRYNWQNFRNLNRNNFRLPRYYAPLGWNAGYRRFGIGFTLSSTLFNQNSWLDDPSYYGLPPAYGPYEWVRYYNDALLVDIRTGYVVDTVYDIFW